MRFRVKLLVLSLLAAAVWQAAPAGAQRRAAAGNPAAALNQLFEEEWEWAMREAPTFASSLGDRRYNDRWTDLSLPAIERRQKHREETLVRLLTIPHSRLAPADRLNYDLFRKDLEDDIREFQFRFYLMPVNQGGGIQSADQLADRLRFQTV